MDEPPILRLDRQSRPQPHGLPAVARVSLTITRGRVRERVRQIRGRVFLIGAASDCDLVLGDLHFPDAYAYVFVSGTEVTIRHLGAGPPLVVNGEIMESGELLHGDVLEMGPFELTVVVEQPPRLRRPEDDDQDESAGSRIVADRTVGIDEVRMLLADIRQVLGEQAAPLKRYEVAGKGAANSRAPLARWVRASA